MSSMRKNSFTEESQNKGLHRIKNKLPIKGFFTEHLQWFLHFLQPL